MIAPNNPKILNYPSQEGFGEPSPIPLIIGGRFSKKTEGVSSLDTSLRIISTKDVVYTPATDINRSYKHTNIEALNYFLNTKKNEIKRKLVNQCLCEIYDLDHYADFNIVDPSIDVSVMVNQRLTSYLNDCLLDYAESKFLNYIKDQKKKHKYIHIYREKQHSLKKLENRYCKSYCKKVKKRMNYVSYKYGNKNAVLLSLTLDPKKYDKDKLRMWLEIKHDFHIFMDRLEHYLKRNGSKLPKYVHAVESQKNGDPHIHVEFLNAKRICDWRKIREYWGKGHIYINRTSKNKKIRYPVHYITKYITKTYEDTNPDNVLNQSMVWLFNMRSFDRSKGLIVPLNPKSTGDWSIYGLATIPVMDSDLDEMIVIQDLIKSLYGGFVDPPPHKLNLDVLNKSNNVKNDVVVGFSA